MRNLHAFMMLTILPAIVAGSAGGQGAPIACNAGFTQCQIPKNVLITVPPSLTLDAGDVVIRKATSNAVRDVFHVFNDFADTGRGTGLGTQAILYSRDDTEDLPDPSTYSANAVFVQEAPSGPTLYTGSSIFSAPPITYQLDTAAASARLVYTGNTTAEYGHTAQLTAVLTAVTSGVPIPGGTLVFSVGALSCSAITNASGLASCTIVPNQKPGGDYTVTTTFTGLFGAYAGASVTKDFNIAIELTALSYTGNTRISVGGVGQVSGVLLDDNTKPITGRQVKFTLGTGGDHAQSCHGVTDATGKAACTISPVAQPHGTSTVKASFDGDAFYGESSTTVSVAVF